MRQGPGYLLCSAARISVVLALSDALICFSFWLFPPMKGLTASYPAPDWLVGRMESIVGYIQYEVHRESASLYSLLTPSALWIFAAIILFKTVKGVRAAAAEDDEDALPPDKFPGSVLRVAGTVGSAFALVAGLLMVADWVYPWGKTNDGLVKRVEKFVYPPIEMRGVDKDKVVIDRGWLITVVGETGQPIYSEVRGDSSSYDKLLRILRAVQAEAASLFSKLRFYGLLFCVSATMYLVARYDFAAGQRSS